MWMQYWTTLNPPFLGFTEKKMSMSYCRWSSDNFKCDVYAYESDFGYEIHIASNRIVGIPPETNYDLLKSGSEIDLQLFVDQEKKRSEWLKNCEREEINLPLVGESFTMPDLESFLFKMIEIKEIGYHIPDWVFNEIKEEIN